MEGKDDPVQTILRKCIETLAHTRSELIRDPVQENENFEFNNFWEKFYAATSMISHESTKLMLAFDSNTIPSPEDCQSLVNELQNKCIVLLAVFFTLPIDKGKLFRSEVKDYVISVFCSVENLVVSLQTNRRQEMYPVGDVWAVCESVNSVSQDMKGSAIYLCREQVAMVSDAIRELTESINEDADVEGLTIPPTESWSPSDRNVLLPCSGLLKASKACLSKVMAALSDDGDGRIEEAIRELDEMADMVKRCSPQADDLVMALYPPMDHSQVRHQASLIRNNCKGLLQYFSNSHVYTASAASWLEFLEKAIDHNWARINDMVLTD